MTNNSYRRKHSVLEKQQCAGIKRKWCRSPLLWIPLGAHLNIRNAPKFSYLNIFKWFALLEGVRSRLVLAPGRS